MKKKEPKKLEINLYIFCKSQRILIIDITIQKSQNNTGLISNYVMVKNIKQPMR